MHDAKARTSPFLVLSGLRAGALLTILGMLSQTGAAIAADDVAEYAGCILDVAGTWTFAGSPGRNARLGEALFAGDALVAVKPYEGSSIEIGYLDKPLIKRECNSKGACANPIRITVERPHETSITDMLVHASEMLARQPSRYIVAMGRSAGGAIVALDHVAEVQDGRIPLAPTFHAPKGRYRVSAYRVRANRGAESAPVAPPKELAWPPIGDDAQLLVPEPGLYQIVLETIEQPPAAIDAWVLAETAARQTASSAQLAALLHATERWQKQGGAAALTARGVGRALLASMAERN
jgi:hypothetical protein